MTIHINCFYAYNVNASSTDLTDSGCHSDLDCLSHPCGNGQTPHCSSHSSHGICYCRGIFQ